MTVQTSRLLPDLSLESFPDHNLKMSFKTDATLAAEHVQSEPDRRQRSLFVSLVSFRFVLGGLFHSRASVASVPLPEPKLSDHLIQTRGSAPGVLRCRGNGPNRRGSGVSTESGF